LLLELLDQARNPLGRLRAVPEPVVYALEVKPQALFLARRDRVEKAQPLDVATVAPVAAVGHHHVVEGPLLRAAPRQTNRHHESGFPRSCWTWRANQPRATARPPSGGRR